MTGRDAATVHNRLGRLRRHREGSIEKRSSNGSLNTAVATLDTNSVPSPGSEEE